ncbi:MAG: hypothetical protein Q9227_008312 [Pyrenula ochraceoflavens]
MSKSLKNFTTIREALDRGDWTPRKLRILFLLGQWHDGIEITKEIVSQSSSWEEKISNFFINAKDILTSNDTTSIPSSNANGAAAPSYLATELSKAETEVYEALCDSFDTPRVMRIISSLITEFNSTAQASLQKSDTFAIAKWITKMVNIFGLNGDASPTSSDIGWSGVDIPEEAKLSIHAVSAFRDDLRIAARDSKPDIPLQILSSLLKKHTPPASSTDSNISKNRYFNVYTNFHETIHNIVKPHFDGRTPIPASDILAAADTLRNVTLPALDIYLEDRESGPALVRPLTSEQRAALESKARDQEAKREKKAAVAKEREEKARKELEKGRQAPLEMFKTAEWSGWDAEGIPTKDKEGKEVTKSSRKRLVKEWERQKGLHEKWKKAQSAVGEGTVELPVRTKEPETS